MSLNSLILPPSIINAPPNTLPCSKIDDDSFPVKFPK